ncbi:MAG TPA: type I-A CRISPR-associated protein Cas5 [Pyrodictium sp.]|nr:type I-A CRISPR-associated protein Cas5 [Pyrodictium sp.]
MKPLMLVSEVELAWGFSVRYAGASAAQPALPIPPPTTIVGFYAEPLARLLDLPEYRGPKKTPCSPAALLAEHTLAASAGLSPDSKTGLVVHSDLSHVVTLPYQRKRKNEWEKFAFAAQAVGAAYGPAARLYLALVVDIEGFARMLGDRPETVAGMLAWSGWRLGSKEGLVSVVRAEALEPEAPVKGVFETILYQEGSLAEPISRIELVEKVHMWKLEPRLFCGETFIPNYVTYHLPAAASSTPSILLPLRGELPGFGARSRVYCHPSRPLCIAARR